MWKDSSKSDEGSKKRFRQITLAQAFKGYNKKLKVELEQGSSRDLAGSSANVGIGEETVERRGQCTDVISDREVVLTDSDVETTEKGSDCEILPEPTESDQRVDTKSLDLSQYSVDLFPEIDSDTSSSVTILDDHESSYDLLSFVASLPTESVLSRLRSNFNHTVLVNYLLDPERIPAPYPKNYVDAWDGNHVRLPCSESNVYPVRKENGEREIRSRWEMFRESFHVLPLSSTELEEAILHYNIQYAKRWNFRALHSFFSEVIGDEEGEEFFHRLLPKIVGLALELPSICTQPIPLLKCQKNHSITFSQQQIACLLANAFLCTFPRRNSMGRGSEYEWYPNINFNLLYSHGGRRNCRKHQKIMCFINYFRRVTSDMPTGNVTFQRQCLNEFPSWKDSSTLLKRFHVQSTGLIETEGARMLQVDFADRFIGGGVLNTGLVQEEVRFVICPELVAARLFTECLDSNEVLLVTGCEQFNSYTGYGDSFTWTGNFVDKTPRDAWSRRVTRVVAMDAIHFRKKEDQYKVENLRRELHKAYCGFFDADGRTNLTAVATGNWGCGVFKGDARLKSLIQYVAASESGRDMAYFTFGDVQLASDLRKVTGYLCNKCATVGQLWTVLERYCNDCVLGQSKPLSLHDYILSSFDSSNDT